MAGIKKVSLLPAKCAVDLSNGSERGYYVNADYILRKLGRPHRAVNIMYCYYPLDSTWPKRAQDAYADMDVSFAWDYPYDNYFPYLGGVNGNQEGEPFSCMRDIRKHGQDVILTLTCDPNVSDDHIIAIAKDLRTYGRIIVRLNHECTGNWFSFNKRASYEELGLFFEKFTKIVHEYAPNVRMMICAGDIKSPDDVEVEKEKEFKNAILSADMWTIDSYLALNWGWPYEVAEKDNFSHKLESPAKIYDLMKRTFCRYRELNGGKTKPMGMAELNADGDVTGPYDQIKYMMEFAELIKQDQERWFTNFTMYQFRDDGRLGLETTDPNNKDVGIEQPLLGAYKKLIHDDFFKPGFEEKEECSLPAILRWGGAEDAEGICMTIDMESDPIFFEANFKEDLVNANLMIEVGGSWFYKAPGVTFVDFMPAFFDKKISEPCQIKLNIFAPPATGENDPSQGEDWQTNYYTTLESLPEIRLRFEPIMTL